VLFNFSRKEQNSPQKTSTTDHKKGFITKPEIKVFLLFAISICKLQLPFLLPTSRNTDLK